MNPAAKNIF